jgi:multisubunit Na+/H+ antiporter MnhC subunit
LLSIVKNTKYLKIVIILILVEFGGNLYFYATGYALNQIGWSYGANIIASGIIQSLACFTLSISLSMQALLLQKFRERVH